MYYGMQLRKNSGMRFGLVLTSLCFHGSFSWNTEGHDAVGATAMSMIDSAASSKLKGILGGQDASEVAGWSHKIEQSLEWTKSLHFLHQDSDWACGVSPQSMEQSCHRGHCLERALRHFYIQATRGDLSDPKNTMVDDTGLTDADAIRFLIGLVGDLVQPLHVGFKSTDFGRNIMVRVPDRPGFPSSVISLYDLWDNKLIEHSINNPYNSNAWWSGWTHVRSLSPAIVQAEKNRWEQKGIDSVADWVKESAEFACNRVYSNPVTKERFDINQSPDNPLIIQPDVYSVWERDMKERILIGGVRLGLILNGILASKDTPAASKLRRGSAVNDPSANTASDIIETFDDLDERGEPANSSRGKRSPVVGYNAGMVNVGILFAVVLIVLIAYKAGATSSSVAFQGAKTQIVEMVGPNAKVLSTHRD